MIFNDTTGAVIAKFVITLIVGAIAFWGITGNIFAMVFALALAVTLVNYVIGDLAILPKAGNVVASIVDGIVAAVIALGFEWAFAGFQITAGSVLLFGVLIAIVEAVFHIFIQKAAIWGF